MDNNRTIYKVFTKLMILSIAITTLLLTACGQTEAKKAKREIWVSIAPIRHLVEQIVGEDFTINIITPPGASPENYELTPKQLIAINEAEVVFTIGLIDFENAITSRIESDANIVRLCDGIELIAGCNHNHNHNHNQTLAQTLPSPKHQPDEQSPAQANGADEDHHHGVDPHIWSSPAELQIMADNIFGTITALYPDSTKYEKGYKTLKEEITATDIYCRELLSASSTRSFVLHHPALTYYARSYGLEQIAIEEQGKEPSARHIARIIEQAKGDGAKCVLYQSQFPRSVVEVVAKDIGVEAMAFDPLSDDILESIRALTRNITGNNEQNDER